MNMQELTEYCQKKFNQPLTKSGWSDKGCYFVKINLPNGQIAEASENIDFSKPPGYYKTHTLQLAVDKAAKMLEIAPLSNVPEKKIQSESLFPDTNSGRALYRKCMATAVVGGIFTLEEANHSLYAPFTSLKEARNLAGQLRFAETMTPDDILKSGKKQNNSFRQLLKDAGWTTEDGRLASKENK